MALHDDACWMDLNGWGGTADDESLGEKADECRRLRMNIEPHPYCAVHGSLVIEEKP